MILSAQVVANLGELSRQNKSNQDSIVSAELCEVGWGEGDKRLMGQKSRSLSTIQVHKTC